MTKNNSYYCVCPPGYSGKFCEFDINDCAPNPCKNNGTCTDKVNDFSCECLHGFSGRTCATHDYWTLQQWTGNACEGKPWRCFRLQMGKCIDTGFVDGNVPKRKNWFGRLKYDKDSLKYTVDLCWGKKDGDDEPLEESCNCDNHYTKIPRLGKNSLGPVSSPDVKDSDGCHKLMRITSSKLVNSTGKNLDKEDNKQNVDCAAPEGGATRPQGLFGMGVITALLISVVRAA